MKFRKETAGAMLFCIVNGILAMQCLTVQIVKKRASVSEKKTERTVPVPERSRDAMKNPWIELDQLNRIFFPFQDGKILCGKLPEKIFEVHLYESICQSDSSAESSETEFIFFPENFPEKLRYYHKGKIKVLYTPNDRENLTVLLFTGKNVSVYEWGAKTSYQLKLVRESISEKELNFTEGSYTVIVLMDSSNKGFYGIVPKKNILNHSNYILASEFSTKKEYTTSFWRVLEVPAYIIDVITFPIQFMGGWMYVIIFGLKRYSDNFSF